MPTETKDDTKTTAPKQPEPFAADLSKLKQAIGILASHADAETQAQVAELLN